MLHSHSSSRVDPLEPLERRTLGSDAFLTRDRSYFSRIGAASEYELTVVARRNVAWIGRRSDGASS
jgi:hypothetical protein